jgi:DNA-directed RNA polymerase subunit RPC12/RpoP
MSAAAPSGVPAAAPAPVKYVCASCLAEQTLQMEQALVCNACTLKLSTSRIFFKKRKGVATRYDTN